MKLLGHYGHDIIQKLIVGFRLDYKSDREKDTAAQNSKTKIQFFKSIFLVDSQGN